MVRRYENPVIIKQLKRRINFTLRADSKGLFVKYPFDVGDLVDFFEKQG